MTRTDTIVAFALDTTLEDVPVLAVPRAELAVADGIGCALAGAGSEVANGLLGVLDPAADGGVHPLLGTGRRAGPLDAALFNGTAAHALEYDDTVHPGPLHPSCHLVPALLAAGAIAESTGPELLTAYLVGVEIEAKLARTLNPAHYAAGWHSTSTLGSIAATAAAGRLLGLTPVELEYGFAIAASSAAGLRANFGTMTKPLHAGIAARSGLLAARLGRNGVAGARQIFDTNHGFLATFGVEGAVDAGRLDGLGRDWELAGEETHGLKPYPCCGETIGLAEAALAARDGLDLDGVEAIDGFTSARAMNILVPGVPATVEAARFSLAFCVAAPLVTGAAGLATFRDDVLAAPAVQDLMARTTHRVDADRFAGPTEFGGRIEVHRRSGPPLVREVTQARGWGERFLTRAECCTKFAECAGGRGDLFDLVSDLRGLDSVKTLVQRLGEGPGAGSAPISTG